MMSFWCQYGRHWLFSLWLFYSFFFLGHFSMAFYYVSDVWMRARQTDFSSIWFVAHIVHFIRPCIKLDTEHHLNEIVVLKTIFQKWEIYKWWYIFGTDFSTDYNWFYRKINKTLIFNLSFLREFFAENFVIFFKMLDKLCKYCISIGYDEYAYAYNEKQAKITIRQ